MAMKFGSGSVWILMLDRKSIILIISIFYNLSILLQMSDIFFHLLILAIIINLLIINWKLFDLEEKIKNKH